mgnify:CR=1 FL=1
MKHYTRFRAYQLGEKGASFSISVDQYFVLIVSVQKRIW